MPSLQQEISKVDQAVKTGELILHEKQTNQKAEETEEGQEILISKKS